MICPNCKLESSDGTRFCPLCGALLPKPPRPQPEAEPFTSRAAQVGYEAYRAFSSISATYVIMYFLIRWSQAFISNFADTYASTAYGQVWPYLLAFSLLLMLAGAVLQFVFALFLQGRRWAAASLIITGALCAAGLALMLLIDPSVYGLWASWPPVQESRFACAVMLGVGVPMLQGALSFCRASYKSTVLRSLLVKAVYLVLSLLGLYLGIVLFAWSIRGVILAVLGPIAALAVSLALNRRVFHAASRPVPAAGSRQPTGSHRRR